MAQSPKPSVRLPALDTLTTRLLILVVLLLAVPLLSGALLTQSLLERYAEAVPWVQYARWVRLMEDYRLGAALLILTSLPLCATVALLASQTITRPLQALITQMNAVSLDTPQQHLIESRHGVRETIQLAAAFNRMLLRLEDSIRLRDEFVATLSHDLKVPLLAERQTLAYMLDGRYGPTTDLQVEVLRAMQTANRSSLELVNGLLNVTRYEAGQVQLCREAVPLDRLLNESLAEIAPLAEDKHLVLQAEVPAASASNRWTVVGDALELKRLLHNLLNNALANTPRFGQVTCRLVDAAALGHGADTPLARLTAYPDSTLPAPGIVLGEGLLVCVSDTGIGIPADDLGQLFQRFSPGRARLPMSLGLGLYQCHQVIDAHGGRIWVETAEGEGTAVIAWLPRPGATASLPGGAG